MTLGYPRAGRRGFPAFGRAMMRLTGWTFRGALPALPKFVIIVAPHTSNWDFPIGVFALFALDLESRWFGKASLFRPPMGFLLRMIQGRPVRRDTPEGMVAEMAAAVRAEPQFVLTLAPEGTRKSVDHWRTGFYRIAEAAGIPIVAVSFDWSRKEIGINAPMHPSGNLAADVAALQAHYRPEMARHPEGFWRARGCRARERPVDRRVPNPLDSPAPAASKVMQRWYRPCTPPAVHGRSVASR